MSHKAASKPSLRKHASGHVRCFMALTLLAVFLSASCAGAGRAPALVTEGEAPAVSRKLARFVYIEEGTDLILTVGVRVAALHEDDDFFPLEVSLTNRMKGVTWVLTRESFRLFDADGQAYELPAHSALLAGYDKRTFDTRLFEARSVTAGKHEGYRQVESNFFPDPVRGINRAADTYSDGTGVAPTSTSLVPIERVELASMSFMEDVLYFPHPAGQLVESTFSLEVRTTGMEEPARIAFTIPRVR